MEVTTQEIEVYSSSEKPSRVENFFAASTSNQFSQKLIKDSRASGANEDVQQLLVSCSGSKGCSFSSEGKEILLASEVEQLNERLKVLEEETEAMKQVFIETREERKKLVNELYQEFLRIQHCGSLRNQVTGLKSWDGSLIINPSNQQAIVGIGLSQVLCEGSNRSIVIRDHRANTQFNYSMRIQSMYSQTDDSS